MSTSFEIAETIIRQLAGSFGKLSAMTGAKNFLHGHTTDGAVGGVSFKFPKPGKGRPNFCRITLDADDTYTIEFGATRGYDYKVISKQSGMYADMLTEHFETTTGLYLSL